MNEQLKKYIEPIKNFWGKMTRRTKMILLICLGGVVLLAIVLGLLMNRTQYSVLYAGMDSDEAQQVMTELQKLDVPYKNSDGTIYVAKDKEDSVRMQLSNEGYPKSVPNYDFFTKNVGVMTTDDERKIIEQYQLQQRLEAVIRTLSPVDTDYVTISLPEGGTYAWDDSKKAATASVTIRLKDGQSLAGQQVSGIKQLVSKSVPNLAADDVSVVDSATGSEFSASSADSANSLQITLSEFKLKIEKEYENNVEGKILSLLEQAYGKGNISVSVKSKMDLDKKIQDIVTYTPSSSSNTGVVSQSQEEHVTTQYGTSSGGAVGAQTNADTTTTYPGVSVNGNVITTKDSKTFSYLVSQVEEQIQSDAAALDDLTVAVVVNTDSMSAAQKQEVTTLVANAAAVDPSKVAVMAAPLNANSAASATTPTSALPMLLGNPLILAAGGAALVLLILLAVLLAARRRKKREELMANLQPIAPVGEPMPPLEPTPTESEAAEEAAEEVAEEGGAEEPPEEPPEEEEESEAQGEAEGEEVKEEEEKPEEQKESIEEIRNAMSGKSDALKHDLQEFAGNNPEIAAQLIRSWLRGEDKHG